ncbi:MAG: YebC/PmpR family DNA-binding transcriptional regulator, partial [Acidaminococcaceae bacterium]|nr:YebC/PmpR family DNA-binding transcriptional regulator [Acidaminococcaceae bacterium]
HAFTKHGGNMGETGSVGWMFKRKGIFTIDKEAGYDEDEVMMIALDAGAEDMKSLEDSFEIVTQPEDYDAVEKALADNNIETVMSEITMVPDTMVQLSAEDAEKVRKTIDMFDDMDDVQEVYTNADLPDEDDEE